jgi:hypothetical protein
MSVFDREKRDKRWREDLERGSEYLVSFTPRRMYENYLLNPRAISAVASQIEGFRPESKVAPEEVERWMDEHGSEPKYFDTKGNLARTDPSWLTEVHGPSC